MIATRRLIVLTRRSGTELEIRFGRDAKWLVPSVHLPPPSSRAVVLGSISFSRRLAHSRVESSASLALDRHDINDTRALSQPHRLHESRHVPTGVQQDAPLQKTATSLDERTNYVIYKTTPGSMDEQKWRQAKRMLDKWTKKQSNCLNSARKAEELLERLVKEAAVNKNHVKVTATMYNQCMNAWANSGDPDAPFHVDAILQLMQSRHDGDPTSCPEPDTISYNTLLKTWAVLSEDDRATDKAEELIHLMEEKQRMNPSGAVKPDTWSYNLVMLAHANRVGEYGSAKAAEDWLLRLSELNVDNNGPRPDTVSFNLVLKAWANNQDEKGPDRALEILSLFIKLSNDGHDIRPDASSFVTVISSFAKRGDVVKAQEVLSLTREARLREGMDLTPCFNAVIDAWAKSGAKDAGHMAESLLKTAQSYSETDSRVVVKPNGTTYTSCLDAHTKSDHPRALEDADSFLGQMIDARRSDKLSFDPTTKTFNCIIRAWAISDRKNKAESAERWLRIMHDLATNESFKCRPNSESFNFCLDAWLHGNSPDAASRATRLLLHTEQLHKQGDRYVRPSGFSYRVVIKLLLSTGLKDDTRMASFFVRKMSQQARRGNSDVQPDTSLCNKVIFGLTQSHDDGATIEALNLLRWMDRASREGITSVRPDTFKTVMSALFRHPNRHHASISLVELHDRMEELDGIGDSGVRVHSTTLRLALAALSRLREEWAADRARAIFDRVTRFADDEKTEQPVLDKPCLTICLETMLNVGTFEYTAKAQGLLKEMILRHRDGLATYLPLRRGFTATVDALSKSGEESSVPLTLELLSILEDVPYDGHFRKGPGAPFYASAINLLIEHGNIQAAEDVLFSWEDKHLRHKDVERASVIIWNKLLSAWSRSKAEDKVVRARGLLDRMKEYSNKGIGGPTPDLTSYNTVMNAASFVGANEQNRQDAWRILRTTFTELTEEDLELDDISYGTMLKGIDRFVKSGSEKAECMKRLFEECCASRKDGPIVMHEIRKVLSEDEIQAIRASTSTPRK